VVFIVAVIFFSGFILGAHSGGHRGPGGHMGDRDFVEFHRGPPPMFGIPPDGQFDRPGPGPSGPGGPRFGPPPGPPSSPSGPQSPGATPTPPRP
jgi:hypothetical protein